MVHKPNSYASGERNETTDTGLNDKWTAAGDVDAMVPSDAADVLNYNAKSFGYSQFEFSHSCLMPGQIFCGRRSQRAANEMKSNYPNLVGWLNVASS